MLTQMEKTKTTRDTEVNVLRNFQMLSKHSRKGHLAVLGPRQEKKPLSHHHEEILALPAMTFPAVHPGKLFRVWNDSDILWSNCWM